MSPLETIDRLEQMMLGTEDGVARWYSAVSALLGHVGRSAAREVSLRLGPSGMLELSVDEGVFPLELSEWIGGQHGTLPLVPAACRRLEVAGRRGGFALDRAVGTLEPVKGTPAVRVSFVPKHPTECREECRLFVEGTTERLAPCMPATRFRCEADGFIRDIACSEASLSLLNTRRSARTWLCSPFVASSVVGGDACHLSFVWANGLGEDVTVLVDGLEARSNVPISEIFVRCLIRKLGSESSEATQVIERLRGARTGFVLTCTIRSADSARFSFRPAIIEPARLERIFDGSLAPYVDRHPIAAAEVSKSSKSHGNWLDHLLFRGEEGLR